MSEQDQEREALRKGSDEETDDVEAHVLRKRGEGEDDGGDDVEAHVLRK
ncbi:MAG TPA: hypothetical protein VE982_02555 [Gaiellaceae bacterium]|nr:hypothetical protein [Gaiellaceae bacterium]